MTWVCGPAGVVRQAVALWHAEALHAGGVVTLVAPAEAQPSHLYVRGSGFGFRVWLQGLASGFGFRVWLQGLASKFARLIARCGIPADAGGRRPVGVPVAWCHQAVIPGVQGEGQDGKMVGT
eukprot:208846-Chlamydomonas_euryale.AAC.1